MSAPLIIARSQSAKLELQDFTPILLEADLLCAVICHSGSSQQVKCVRKYARDHDDDPAGPIQGGRSVVLHPHYKTEVRKCEIMHRTSDKMYSRVMTSARPPRPTASTEF